MEQVHGSSCRQLIKLSADLLRRTRTHSALNQHAVTNSIVKLACSVNGMVMMMCVCGFLFVLFFSCGEPRGAAEDCLSCTTRLHYGTRTARCINWTLGDASRRSLPKTSRSNYKENRSVVAQGPEIRNALGWERVAGWEKVCGDQLEVD